MTATDVLTRAHPDLIRALSAATTNVRLVSPFLTGDIALELAGIAATSPAKWTLLTALNPRAVAGGFLSTTGLRALAGAGVETFTVGRLHAKTYLTETTGFLGSGNLTAPGLGRARPNLELTTRLSDAQLATTHEIVTTWLDAATAITEANLRRAERQAKTVPVVVAVPPTQSPDDDEVATQLLADARHVRLWTKAVYGTFDEHDWTAPDRFVSSSRIGKPQFAPGDLALIYSRDEGACNAIVEITAEAVFDPGVGVADGWPQEDADRWPWVNYVTNRLTVPAERAVRAHDLGFKTQALQAGHREMNLGEFAAAVQILTGTDLTV